MGAIDQDQILPGHGIECSSNLAIRNVRKFFKNCLALRRAVLNLPVEWIAQEIEDIDFKVVDFHITPLRGFTALPIRYVAHRKAAGTGLAMKRDIGVRGCDPFDLRKDDF